MINGFLRGGTDWCQGRGGMTAYDCGESGLVEGDGLSAGGFYGSELCTRQNTNNPLILP